MPTCGLYAASGNEFATPESIALAAQRELEVRIFNSVANHEERTVAVPKKRGSRINECGTRQRLSDPEIRNQCVLEGEAGELGEVCELGHGVVLWARIYTERGELQLRARVPEAESKQPYHLLPPPWTLPGHLGPWEHVPEISAYIDSSSHQDTGATGKRASAQTDRPLVVSIASSQTKSPPHRPTVSAESMDSIQ
jgi:hypothetical protein